jgi:hypothetical protein
LSEQAALAGVDARNAFTKENDQTTIQHLIEPFRWPVEANLDLASYPGQLTITNDPANGSAPVSLAGISALEGISGRFAEQGGNRITRVGSTAEPPAPTEFGVRAGSMDAFTANGRFRDQRGLWRAATHTAANFIFTPIQLQNETDDESLIFNQTSAKSAISLEIAEDNIWNFWFRDLPVQPSGEFDRKRRLSEKNQDVNDSEALSREYNHLAGYEWRLGNANGLSIASLDFFPLTLERVQFDENQVLIQVGIIGRLQMPLSSNQVELENLNNAVRVVFTASGATGKLELSDIGLEDELGEWPLQQENGEQTGGPRLMWREIALVNDNGGKQIVVSNLFIRFYLFDTLWQIPWHTSRDLK